MAVGALVGVGAASESLADNADAGCAASLDWVGAASESQAKTAIAMATVAVNSIKTLKRLIETPCKIKMCARPAQVSRDVSIRGPQRGH